MKMRTKKAKQKSNIKFIISIIVIEIWKVFSCLSAWQSVSRSLVFFFSRFRSQKIACNELGLSVRKRSELGSNIKPTLKNGQITQMNNTKQRNYKRLLCFLRFIVRRIDCFEKESRYSETRTVPPKCMQTLTILNSVFGIKSFNNNRIHLRSYWKLDGAKKKKQTRLSQAMHFIYRFNVIIICNSFTQRVYTVQTHRDIIKSHHN